MSSNDNYTYYEYSDVQQISTTMSDDAGGNFNEYEYEKRDEYHEDAKRDRRKSLSYGNQKRESANVEKQRKESLKYEENNDRQRRGSSIVSQMGSDNVDRSEAPVRKRCITDPFLLFLFTLLVLGMVGLSSYSGKRGDPYRYYKGYDSWGNVCGRKDNARIPGVELSGKDLSNQTVVLPTGLSHPKILSNPIKYLDMFQKSAFICIRECPDSTTDCKTLLKQNNYTLPEEIIDKYVCVMPLGLVVPHEPFLRRCIPTMVVQAVSKATGDMIPISTAENVTFVNATNPAKFWTKQSKQFVVSITTYGKSAIGLTTLSFVFCFIMLIFFQFLTRFLTWALIASGTISSVWYTCFMWYRYYQARKSYQQLKVTRSDMTNVTDPKILKALENLNVSRSIRDLSSYLAPNVSAITNPEMLESWKTSNAFRKIRALSDNLPLNFDFDDVKLIAYNTSQKVFRGIAFEETKDPQAQLGWTIFVTVATLIFLILIIWLRKKMNLLVELFQQGSKAVASIPCILLQPVVTFFALMCLTIYFFAVGAFILTIDVPVVDKKGFVTFEDGDTALNQKLFFGHTLGVLWLWKFIDACESIIIAGTIADWFFLREQRSCGCGRFCSCVFPTCSPTLDLIRYNLGTAAFGSLVISVVHMLKVIFQFVSRKIQKYKSATQLSLPRMGCETCLYCLRKLIHYFNRNAYICNAIYGTSFITSGKKAFSLLITNAGFAFLLNFLGNFLLFIGKIAVVLLTMSSSLYYFWYNLGQEAFSSEYGFVVATIGVGSYIIARCFFNVYGLVLDTLFICFCEDLERNDGKTRPYFASSEFRSCMKKAARNTSSKSKLVSPEKEERYNDEGKERKYSLY